MPTCPCHETEKEMDRNHLDMILIRRNAESLRCDFSSSVNTSAGCWTCFDTKGGMSCPNNSLTKRVWDESLHRSQKSMRQPESCNKLSWWSGTCWLSSANNVSIQHILPWRIVPFALGEETSVKTWASSSLAHIVPASVCNDKPKHATWVWTKKHRLNRDNAMRLTLCLTSSSSHSTQDVQTGCKPKGVVWAVVGSHHCINSYLLDMIWNPNGVNNILLIPKLLALLKPLAPTVAADFRQ